MSSATRNKEKYNKHWKRKRDAYIRKHPTCELCIEKAMCRRNYKIKPATEVHHIIPVCEGGQHIDANLVALCHACHMEIHLREERSKE